jgi:MFS family permease
VVTNRNFSLLLVGQGLSALGDFLFDTTLVLWIGTVLLAGRSYAPAAVGGVMVAICVATIVVAPLAGVFVDRWDKRRTMLVGDIARMLLVAVLAVAVALPRDALPAGAALALVYVVVLLATAFGQFFRPAQFTLIGDIVEGDAERAAATGRLQAVATVAAITGPPLAAPLLFTVGAQWALWVDVLTFLVSFLTIRAIRPVVSPPRAPAVDAALEPAGLWREFAAGARFLVASRVLVALLLAITVATLGTGALNTLDVFFVTQNLHVDAHWYGTLGMAEGLGGLLGALSAGWLCRRFVDVRVFGVGILLVGILIVAYSRQQSLAPAVVVLALAGVPLGAVNAAVSPIIFREVPRALLGRIISVVNPIQQVASMTSALVAGWLLSGALRDLSVHVGGIRFGPIDAIFGVCGVLVAIAGMAALIVLRRPEIAPDATVEGEVAAATEAVAG